MQKTNRPGAKGAILDEYEKVIAELKECIQDISDNELAFIVDPDTGDENCKSIQTILTHVVNSGYGYAVYIDNLRGNNSVRPDKKTNSTAKEYISDLTDVFRFTLSVFEPIKDMDLEEYDQAKKLITRWGQFYDIEQMMEHAIVHILRHRRQIEKFKIALRIT
jgi:DinB superfamily